MRRSSTENPEPRGQSYSRAPVFQQVPQQFLFVLRPIPSRSSPASHHSRRVVLYVLVSSCMLTGTIHCTAALLLTWPRAVSCEWTALLYCWLHRYQTALLYCPTACRLYYVHARTHRMRAARAYSTHLVPKLKSWAHPLQRHMRLAPPGTPVQATLTRALHSSFSRNWVRPLIAKFTMFYTYLRIVVMLHSR